MFTHGHASSSPGCGSALVCTSTSHAGIDRGPCRIIELLGVDRPGLLADIMATLSHSACDAWSASIWTNLNRATFVLGVNDTRFPLNDPANWRALRSRLQQVMGGPAAHTIVQLSSVVRPPSLLSIARPQYTTLLFSADRDTASPATCELFRQVAIVAHGRYTGAQHAATVPTAAERCCCCRSMWGTCITKEDSIG